MDSLPLEERRRTVLVGLKVKSFQAHSRDQLQRPVTSCAGLESRNVAGGRCETSCYKQQTKKGPPRWFQRDSTLSEKTFQSLPRGSQIFEVQKLMKFGDKLSFDEFCSSVYE